MPAAPDLTSVRFAAREGHSTAYGERQNVVIPSKNMFFDSLSKA